MSQCSRVLEVLRDHRIHTMEEIHQRAGTMRLNSRISDLRKMGYNIACFKTGRVYRYQLLPLLETVQTPGETAATAAASGPPASGPSSTSGGPSPDAAVGPKEAGSAPSPQEDPQRGQLPSKQLSVFEAAA
jgi:hypothetical protein